MRTTLNELECRVIGVLLEKSMTTPEQYPLSLNALTNGCNQKSNRVPVMSLTEAQVSDILDTLQSKRLVQVMTGFGSRVDKYAHRFCNTEFSDIKLTDEHTALITELMLRGPQTPGELRGRSQRMATLKDVSEVESALASLQAYQPYPLVRRLEREPGKREARYQHCFSDTDGEHNQAAPEAPAVDAPHIDNNDRITALENEVKTLKSLVATLLNRVDALTDK